MCLLGTPQRQESGGITAHVPWEGEWLHVKSLVDGVQIISGGHLWLSFPHLRQKHLTAKLQIYANQGISVILRFFLLLLMTLG